MEVTMFSGLTNVMMRMFKAVSLKQSEMNLPYVCDG